MRIAEVHRHYRCGIIGLGRIGTLLEKDKLRPKPCSHAGFYQQHARCHLVAGADSNSLRREEFSEDWQLDSQWVYPNYSDMLEQADLNLVSICAYAPERLEMCQAALLAGAQGLWIEKTLGCSLAEAEKIGELTRQYNAKAIVDYPRRARPAYRAVKRAIDENKFGKLQSVTCHMTHQLLHTGTHAFDILRYWCGEAVSISGKLQNGFEGNEIQDQGGVAQIEFDSGTTAFVSAKKKQYYIFQFDLIFDNARILLGNDIQKVYLPDQSKLYSGFKELFESDAFCWNDPHREHLLQDLIDAIELDREPLCSIENAIEALRIGLGIFYSHKAHSRWVTLDEVPKEFYIPNL